MALKLSVRAALASLIILSGCSAQTETSNKPAIYNFEECVAAGHVVLKTDPPQCRAPDGRVYTGIKGYSDQVIAQRIGQPVRSYEECVAQGNPIQKSYPPQCVTPDGQRFIQGRAPAPQGSGELCKDLCGNGTCEEIVCMGQGCPCPETSDTCPTDCK